MSGESWEDFFNRLMVVMDTTKKRKLELKRLVNSPLFQFWGEFKELLETYDEGLTRDDIAILMGWSSKGRATVNYRLQYFKRLGLIQSRKYKHSPNTLIWSLTGGSNGKNRR